MNKSVMDERIKPQGGGRIKPQGDRRIKPQGDGMKSTINVIEIIDTFISN